MSLSYQVLRDLEIIVGHCEGAKLGIHALAGFPSLKTLTHTAELGHRRELVFSSGGAETRVWYLGWRVLIKEGVEEAKDEIGRRVFVGQCSRCFTPPDQSNFVY